MKELYKKYIFEKNKLNVIKTNYIDLGSFLSVPIFYSFSDNTTFIKNIKSLIGKIFFIKDIKIKSNITNSSFKNILFKRNEFNRSDYENIENFFINTSLKKFNCFELSFGNRKFDINFIQNIALYLKYKKQFKKIDLCNYKINALKFLQASKYDKTYRKIIREFNINKIVVFCDIHENDNYLVQLGNHFNIATYTLQHGMFNYESRKYDDPNFLHCEASKARYVFVWGQHTKDEFIKCGRKAESIFVSGNPKLLSRLTYDKREFKNKTNFIVVFDHSMYAKSNINLLKIADAICKRTGLKYEVKMHPNNNIHNYKQYSSLCSAFYKNEIDYDYITNNAKFVICHNTAMYYELTSFLVPTFRFKDEFFSNIDEFDFNKFSNETELTEKLSYIENNVNTYFEKLEAHSKYYFYNGNLEDAILNGLMTE